MDRFFQTLRAARQRLLCIDYDGTLAPFQTDRSRAVPYPGVPEQLTRLQDPALRTRLVIVSGRPATEVAAFLEMAPHPEIWGAHGWERLTATGEYVPHLPSPEIILALDEAHHNMQQVMDPARCERKIASVAVHWRGLSDEQRDDIRKNVKKRWPVMPGLALQEFAGGLELRAVGHDKGTVMRALLKEMTPPMAVAYLGDDATDEDAFAALPTGGLAVLVRDSPRPSLATVQLRPPEEMLAFLARWEAACQIFN